MFTKLFKNTHFILKLLQFSISLSAWILWYLDQSPKIFNSMESHDSIPIAIITYTIISFTFLIAYIFGETHDFLEIILTTFGGFYNILAGILITITFENYKNYMPNNLRSFWIKMAILTLLCGALCCFDFVTKIIKTETPISLGYNIKDLFRNINFDLKIFEFIICIISWITWYRVPLRHLIPFKAQEVMEEHDSIPVAIIGYAIISFCLITNFVLSETRNDFLETFLTFLGALYHSVASWLTWKLYLDPHYEEYVEETLGSWVVISILCTICATICWVDFIIMILKIIRSKNKTKKAPIEDKY